MKAILSDLARPRLLAVVTVTAIIGILGGLLPMLPLGNLRPDGFNAEIVYRFNDFENYGWHRAEKTDASIHPVYATAIAANKTLPVLIATLGHLWTGSDVLGRLTVFFLYFAAYGIAVPLFVLALTHSGSAAIVTAFAMAALDWKELIYGYSNMPFFGRVATTLFVLELALLVMKRRNVAFAIWAIHLVTHPTTAVAWFFPLFAFAVLLDSDRWPHIREKSWHFVVILAAPLALACTLVAAEKSGILFPGVDDPSYWAIIRVRTLHTLFLNTERSFVLVLYAQLCLALAVLGWSSFGDRRLNLLNRIVSAYGLGMLITSITLVETETSVSVAALLPLRYADVMFVVLILNLVSILLGNRSNDWGCRFSAAVMFALLLVGHDVNPLFGIGLWAVGQRVAEQNVRLYKVALMLFATGIASVGVVALLPTADDFYSRWYFKPWMDSPKSQALVSALSDKLSIPTINSEYAVIFAHDIIIIIAVVLVGVALRRLFLAKIALVAVAIYAIGPIAHRIVRFPFRAAATELPIAVGLIPNRNDPSAELMTWMQREIPRGDGVLGDPNLFFRLKLSARVSVDDDLLSLVPYVPATSASVVNEYRRLYMIDFLDLAKKHQRVGEVFGDAAWGIARQKVLAGEISEYEWVVERASQKPAAFPISFENSAYRVYSRKKSASALQWSTGDVAQGASLHFD
jgi:hypothetical protein